MILGAGPLLDELSATSRPLELLQPLRQSGRRRQVHVQADVAATRPAQGLAQASPVRAEREGAVRTGELPDPRVLVEEVCRPPRVGIVDPHRADLLRLPAQPVRLGEHLLVRARRLRDPQPKSRRTRWRPLVDGQQLVRPQPLGVALDDLGGRADRTIDRHHPQPEPGLHELRPLREAQGRSRVERDLPSVAADDPHQRLRRPTARRAAEQRLRAPLTGRLHHRILVAAAHGHHRLEPVEDVLGWLRRVGDPERRLERQREQPTRTTARVAVLPRDLEVLRRRELKEAVLVPAVRGLVVVAGVDVRGGDLPGSAGSRGPRRSTRDRAAVAAIHDQHQLDTLVEQRRVDPSELLVADVGRAAPRVGGDQALVLAVALLGERVLHLRAVPRVVEEGDVAPLRAPQQVLVQALQDRLPVRLLVGEHPDVVLREAKARHEDRPHGLRIGDGALEVLPLASPMSGSAGLAGLGLVLVDADDQRTPRRICVDGQRDEQEQRASDGADEARLTTAV